MKTLNLTLKKKWFDMIASGEKKEEYREIKPYWMTRFIDTSRYPKESKEDGKYIPDNICFDVVENGHDFHEAVKNYYSDLIPFETVTFKNGYSKDARTITVEFKGIDIGEAVDEWSGSWPGNVFRIKLGKILH